MTSNSRQRVYEIVKLIPKGKIMSFSQIGRLTGLHPRTVGNILTTMQSEDLEKIPWHRVVNNKGYISSIKLGLKGKIQENLLRKEGLKIIDYQIIDYEKYWHQID